jgi:SAM-dependent methyltransferase
VRRLSDWSRDQIIEYNLRNGGNEFTEFDIGQPDRVMKARQIIERIGLELIREQAIATIVEPGCSTGDISGWFAQYGHTVIGIDVTPGAAARAREKWPRMTVIEAAAEDVEPMPCDILVLCEFLEHIADPVGFVEAWMPLARYVVIGHPLVGGGHDQEPGHLWAYTPDDFTAWFPMGGHTVVEAWSFGMAGYTMAIGWGKRS